MKLDMPTSPVHDMKIHERDDDLVVATHGRGIYIADLAPFAQLTAAVLAEDAWLFEPEPEVRWVADDRTNYASSNFTGESEEEGASLYYYLRNGVGDDATLTVYQRDLAISEIELETDAGLHKVQWDMVKRVERSAEEQERLREEMEEGGGGGGFFGGGPSREERIRYEMSDAPPGEYRIAAHCEP